MGFRFRKSFKIAKGVRFNVGKKSTGFSFGGKGAGISFNSRTGARARFSIPGTGISYSTKIGGSTKRKSSHRKVKPRQYASQTETRAAASSAQTTTAPVKPKQAKKPEYRSATPELVRRDGIVGMVIVCVLLAVVLWLFKSPIVIGICGIILAVMSYIYIGMIVKPEKTAAENANYNKMIDEQLAEQKIVDSETADQE